MAMLTLEKRSQLEALHTGNVKESLTLEYKASPAIDKRDDIKKLEMARDVSAFANADGGQIVYGMTESDHEPTGLDEGVDEKAHQRQRAMTGRALDALYTVMIPLLANLICHYLSGNPGQGVPVPLAKKDLGT
jgi:hypothetical protein